MEVVRDGGWVDTAREGGGSGVYIASMVGDDQQCFSEVDLLSNERCRYVGAGYMIYYDCSSRCRWVSLDNWSLMASLSCSSRVGRK